MMVPIEKEEKEFFSQEPFDPDGAAKEGRVLFRERKTTLLTSLSLNEKKKAEVTNFLKVIFEVKMSD